MKKLLILSLALVFLQGCGKEYTKTPVDEQITKLNAEKVPMFSIILNDMDVDGIFFKDYKHKYQIIRQYDSVKIKEQVTDWIEVSEEFFWENENYLGMEIASKGKDGKIVKSASPAGYNNYVGNPQYGHWVNGSGGSFWQFYGQYMFLSSMLNLASGSIYRGDYDDFNRNYRYRKPYYGKDLGGGSKYGTYGSYTSKTRPATFNEKLGKIKSGSQSFKEKVNNKVSRSTGRGTPNVRSRGGFGGK